MIDILLDSRMKFKKYIISLLLILALSACATLPPLQEMSNARQTIAAAKEMSPDAIESKEIQEAERLLSRAERRMEVNLYESARQDALRAQKEAIDFIEWAISETMNERKD
jgi:flagellar basal body L-ring protein FlgH